MYRKILVPYDGSQPSNKALQHAVDLARSVAGKPNVILLHVVSEFPDYHFVERPARSIKTGEKITLSKYLTEVHEMMIKSAEDELARKKDEIKRSKDFEIKTVVRAGHVSSTIREFAEKERVDLVVIGNVGRSGVGKLRTLGSVSRSISERAPCPVMIVH